MLRWAALVLAGLVLIASACGGEKKDRPSAEDLAAAICGAVAEPDATVDTPAIIEASGIAASKRNDGVLWVHNDSGDTARFFAIDRSGRQLGTYTLQGASAVDWEDMAIGAGPERGVDYLYLADIGDNAAQRADVTVYRVPEPDVATTTDTPTANSILDFDVLRLRYPDRPHDAETFMVDPMNGDLLIVTKELAGNVSGVYRALPSVADGPASMERIATVDFSALTLAATPRPDAPTLVKAVPLLPTGGDISRDANLVAIRTYGAVLVWARPQDATMADVFATKPCEAPSAIEQQGEAIAFDPDGRGYTTTSEGGSPKLHHFVVQ